MPRLLKILLITAAGLLAGCLLILIALFALLSSLRRWDWVNGLPKLGDVRMEPSRPVLKLSDVPPGSAFDLLNRAAQLEAKVSKPPTFDAEMSKLFLVPWADETFPSVLEMLTQNEEAMRLARQATTAKNPQVPTYFADDSLAYLSPLMQIEKLFRASAARDIADEDFEGAYSELNRAIDVADSLSRGSPAIHRLVEISSEITAFRAMRLIALQNIVPAFVAQEAIRHLNAIDSGMEPWAEMYREEGRAAPEGVRKFFDPSVPFTKGYEKTDLGRRLMALHWCASHFGALAGSSPKQATEDIERVDAALIEMAERPYDPVRLRNLDAIFSREMDVNGWLTIRDPFIYAEAKQSISVFGPVDIKHYLTISELRLTQVVLAILQFEQAEERLPGTLDELVPAYLAAVPLDPFDDKPLRYAKKPANGWIVYSVGPNQKDEGGLVAEKRALTYDRPGDLVYSSTEAVDERTRIMGAK